MGHAEFHNLFYLPPQKIKGKTIKIDGPEFHHIKNVLRKKQGDGLQLTDGKGGLYKTSIMNIESGSMTVDIIEQTDSDRTGNFTIDLAFVPVKGNRNDFIIEKGTELGIRSFILFMSKNSVVKDLSKARVSRYTKIAISAMLQSQQYYLPEIAVTDNIVALFENYGIVVVADRAGHEKMPVNGATILYIVGPEGGFTDEEIQRFKGSGARLLSLGCNRLRSETAAITGIVKILAERGAV